MLRWTLGLVVAAILTGFMLLLVHGEYSHEGGVVLTLSAARQWGIHRGDILVAGGWLMAMVALTTLVLDRPAPVDGHARRGHDGAGEVRS